jgi:DNA-binding NarL/FixJ family response regulator
MERLKVLLAEDHTVVREGTRQILEREASISVVGEAADGAEAIALAAELKPDLLLLDLGLPVMNGIEVTRALRRAGPRPYVLLLSAYDDEDYVLAAIEAGATGYLLKTARSADVLAAIHAVARGELVLHPLVARKLLSREQRDAVRQPLSDREIEVLHLAASGMRNGEIARTLSLSTRTIEGHLTNIFNKLGVGSRTEAIVKAAGKGWIRLEREPAL